MTENVWIQITAQHCTDGEQTVIEQTVRGRYALFQGKHILRYEETPADAESDAPAVPCMLKIHPEQISLTKKGDAPVRLCFSPKTSHHVLYPTPLGALPLRIVTSKLHVTESADALAAQLSYRLCMNDAPVSDCTMSITVHAAEETAPLPPYTSTPSIK